jgi:serine phosphatase RsbU (regulator of sigma subunit)
MKKTILLFIIVFSATNIKAQEGAPLLSNFRESSELENQNWAICQDDYNVMLFANRRGIMTFDGQRWNVIPVPTIPYSLKYSTIEKKVYVGGDDNYGYLSRDDKGIYKYFSLSGNSSSIGIITRIVINDSTVYFYGEQSISRHNIKNGKLEVRLQQKGNKPFTGIVVTPRNTFINVSTEGLYRLESDTLFPIVTGYLTKDCEILFTLPYSNNLVLLGKSTGDLSLFDGIKYYDYPIKDEDYLHQNILSEGLSISDSLYAFSTLEGGAIVVERKSGRVKNTINYSNGLPDDEIFALGSDNNNGLWLSHQYGLTRADLNLPIANFSIYPGLKGNIISSLWNNNELYVATSEGVYYLKEVKNYTEVEVLVNNKGFTAKTERSAVRNMPVPLQVQEVQKTRRSIFSQIFGKKTVSTVNQPVTSQQPVNQQSQVLISPPVLKIPEPKYFKKVAGRLKSVNYIYKKIDGLDEKCKQLVSAGNDIIASTNKGLFIITEHTAKPVGGNGYINVVSAKSRSGRYYIGTSEGYFYVMSNGKNKWTAYYPDNTFIHPVYSIVCMDDETVWAGSDDVAYRINLNNEASPDSISKFSVRNDLPQRYVVESVNDTIFLFTLSGVHYFNQTSNTFVTYRKNFATEETKLKYVFSQPGNPWIKTEDSWYNLSIAESINSNDKAILKIFDNPHSIYTGEDKIWIVSGDNMLYRIVRNKITMINSQVSLFIRSISNAKGLYYNLTNIVFGSDDNTVYFETVAPGYLKQNSTQYQYIVDKEMNEWSKWSFNNTITLMIKSGKYTLRVRAKDIWGNISEPKIIGFTIETPFTQTTLFYVLILASGLVIIIVIIIFRERQLKKDKRILETRVKERTAKIEAQKQEITSSIEYASRIQRAMLPENEHFSNSFSDYFVIFKPRDIVSGDFYWFGEDDKHIFFTVADCTGHGVPGAFMSTLGISTLDEIIANNPNLRANTVLNILRDKIKTSLHQTGKQGEATDGMDVAFCILHKNRKKLEFSGAYNPLFLIHNGEFKEYRADRMPIGIYYGEKDTFTNYEIEVQKGDTIYIFTDGFADQFGGPKGLKYMKYNLKKLLIEISHKPMNEQQAILEHEFTSWQGSASQIDDVTILGVRI